MKALKFTTLMAFGLSIPFVAMSSNGGDIQRHAMLMHEISQDSGMKWVLVPGNKHASRQLLAKNSGAGSGKKAAKGTKKQFQKRAKKQLQQGQGEGEMDRDRDRTQDQDQMMSRDQDQNRIRYQD